MERWSILLLLLLHLVILPSEGHRWRKRNRGFRCREEGIFTHATSCTKFHRCVFQEGSLHYTHLTISCPQGLVFNSKLTSCSKYSSSRRCQAEGFALNRTRTEEYRENRRLPCKKEGFFAHPDDCGRFYRCIDYDGKGKTYTAFEYSCPKNLLFNKELNSCDWPNFTPPCATSIEKFQEVQTGNKVTHNPQKQKTESPGSKIHFSDEKENDSESIKCKKEGFFRNPKNCRKFFRCVDLTGQRKRFRTYHFKCPQGLVFDEKLSTCNWPAKESSCDIRIDETIRESDKTTHVSSLKIRKPTKGSSTQKESLPCSKHGFFRHPTNCSKFYRCVKHGNHYNSYVFSCPKKLVFDEGTSSCNWPEKSDPCTNNFISINKPPARIIVSTHHFHDKTRANRYPRSLRLRETAPSFPYLSSVFYATPRRTVTGSFVAKHDPGSNLTCEKEGVFKHPQYCHEFYVCSDFKNDGKTYTVFEFVCPNDMVYDEDLDDCAPPPPDSPCAHPEPQKCDHDGGGETPGGSTESPDSSTKSKDDDSSDTTKEGAVSTETSETGDTETTKQPPETGESGTTETGNATSPIKCTKSGYFRHPDDCNRFYRCVDFNDDGKNFVVYEFRCGEGLVFDEINSVCNWPSSVPSCDSSSGEGGEGKESEIPPTDSEGATTESTSDTKDGSGGGKSTPGTADGDGSGATDESETSTTKSEGTSTESTSTPKEISKSKPGSEDGDISIVSDNIECTEAGFFRNPNNCSKFYRCVNESDDGKSFRIFHFDCPSNLVFDEVLSVCNWPDQAQPPCKLGNGTAETKDETSTESEDGSSGKTSESGTDTDDESTIGQGSTVSTASPAPSESTDTGAKDSTTTKKDCPTKSDDEAITKEPATDKEGNGRPTPDSDDKDDTASPDSDDKGDTASPDSDDKDDTASPDSDGKDDTASPDSDDKDDTASPDSDGKDDTASPDSDDKGDTASPDSDGKDDTASPDSGDKDDTASPDSGDKDDTASSGGSSSDSGSIECKKAGYFRNPSNCSKFYRCVGNGNGPYRIYHFECPSNLVFDEVSSVCNWPHRAQPPCKNTTGTSGDKKETDNGGTTGQTTKTTDSEMTPIDGGKDDEPSIGGKETSSPVPITDEGKSEGEKDATTEKSIAEGGEKSTSPIPPSEGKGEKTTPVSGGKEGESSTDDESTRKPSQKVECKKEGFYRNPSNCSKFYRCVDEGGDGKAFRIYHFDCPSNLVFDEVSSVCNWPDQAQPPCQQGDTSKNGSKDSGVTSAETTTTPSSGQTSSGGDTDDGSSSESSKGTSKDASQVPSEKSTDCPPSSKQTTQSSVATDMPTDDSESSSDGPDDGSKPSTTKPPDDDGSKESTSKSPDDDESKGSTSKSPDDDGSKGSTSKSPDDDGSKGSTSKSPDDDGSKGSTSKSPDDDGKSTTQISKDGESSKSSEDTDSTGTKCTEEGFFRHPEDCSKFFRCVDYEGSGKTFAIYHFDCPENTAFDDVLDVCVWPEQARPPCGEKSGGSVTDEQGKGTSSTASDKSSDDSAAIGETTTAVPNTSQPSSTERDQGKSKDGISTYPPSSKETDESKGEDGQPTDETSSKPTDDETSGSKSTTGHESTTQPSTDSVSKGSNDSALECKEAGFFRHPKNCSKFYRCVDNSGSGKSFTIYHFECPNNTMFDDILDVCVWPEQVRPPCNMDSSGEEEMSTSSPKATDRGEESTVESSKPDGGEGESTPFPKDSEGSKENTEPPSDGPIETSPIPESEKSSTDSSAATKKKQPCPDDEDTKGTTAATATTTSEPSDGASEELGSSDCTKAGFFRNPDDCSKFYRCVDYGDGKTFKKYDFNCPDNTVFDDVLDVCVWPGEEKPPCQKEEASKEEDTNIIPDGKERRRRHH